MLDYRSDGHALILGAVLTVPEVVKMFHKNKKSVMMAIYKDQIRARQSGGKNGIWLITLASCTARWGEPAEELQID